MIPGKFPHLAVATAGVDGVGSPSTRTRRGRRVSTSAVAAPNAFGADRGKSVGRSRVAAGVSDPGYSTSLGYTNHGSLLTDHSGVTGSGGDAALGEPLVLDCLWAWA